MIRWTMLTPVAALSAASSVPATAILTRSGVEIVGRDGTDILTR